ncbi:MAG: hypothetical protein ACTSU2_16210 [Promethearchaeota archaeon]
MRVAFGKVVLTPPESLGGIIGVPLAGYTPVQKCTGKYDDIMAHAILIEETVLGNVKKMFLLISTDFLKIPLLWSDYVKELIEKRYRIYSNQIIIHAIHTHKSMDMSGEFVFGDGLEGVIRGIMFGAYHGDDKYKVWAAKRIEKMVGQMLEDLQPAEIAWKKKILEKDILFNRRNPLRHTKGKLGVITFRNKDTHEMIGVYVTFNMHPTTLANFVNKMSADYPGRVCEKIEELSGGKWGVAFFTGPAGDINPITTVKNDMEFLAKQSEDYRLNQRGTLKHTKKLGYYLGQEAFNLANSIEDDRYYDKIDFKTYTKTFWVPMKDYKRYNKPFKITQRLIYLLKRYFLFPIALVLGDENEPNFPGFAVKHKGILRPSAKINVYSMVTYTKCKVWKSHEAEADNQNNDEQKANSNEKGTNAFTRVMVPDNAISLDFVGVPGELFEEIEEAIYKKTDGKYENTFIIQNANDWVSYLFTINDYINYGGYEPFASFSPYSGSFVKYAFFRLIKDIDSGIIAGYY